MRPKRGLSKVSAYCALCDVHHFPLDLYRRWMAEYKSRGKVFLSSGKPSLMQQQLDRWSGILERHARQAMEESGEGVRQDAWGDESGANWT